MRIRCRFAVIAFGAVLPSLNPGRASADPRKNVPPPPAETRTSTQAEEAHEDTGKASRAASMVPDWIVDAKWYEIEVDRFCNANPDNDLGIISWDTPALAAGARAQATPDQASEAQYLPDMRRYGGDLQGVASRLGYLKQLGVDAMILDPVFDGAARVPPSIRDLKHVDDAYGVRGSLDEVRDGSNDPKGRSWSASDRVLIDLVAKAHEQGLRIVLGGLFGDLGRMVAIGPTSESDRAEAARRWLDPDADGDPRDGVDGFVVTPSVDATQESLQSFTSLVHKVNPRGAVVLRDAARGSNPQGMNGVDAIVSPRASAVFFGCLAGLQRDSTPDRFFEDLAKRHPQTGRLGGAVDLLQISGFMGPRAATVLALPMPTFSASAALSAPKPNDATFSRVRLVTVLQHLSPGAPVTYYGDEVGRYGLCTPGPRGAMWWNDLPDPKMQSPDFRGDLFALIQWLHDLRDKYPAIRRGDYQPVLFEDEKKILSFARALPGEQVILLMNYGDAKQLVNLPVGKPGDLVGVLSPLLDPSQHPKYKRANAPPYDRTKIEPLQVGGSRQFVNQDGTVRLWINPMSVRIVIAGERVNSLRGGPK